GMSATASSAEAIVLSMSPLAGLYRGAGPGAIRAGAVAARRSRGGGWWGAGAAHAVCAKRTRCEPARSMQGRALGTLTTDVGTRDGYVGAMKGVVAALAPGAALVDVAHDVGAGDVVGGALALAQAAPYFPPGTVHVVVVDPGVGGARAEVAVAAGGQLYVGPD